MTTGVTFQAGISCQADAVPVAVQELFEAPGAVRQAPALQARLQTTVHAVDGVVYVVAGDDEWVLTPGDSAAIDPGVTYRRWNAGDDQAHWLEVYCGA
jgi:mannose-6-phosphate isomerase-like protein (cupin superfamily)